MLPKSLQKKEAQKVLENLKARMETIDLRSTAPENDDFFSSPNAKKAQRLIEKIDVPALLVLKDRRRENA